MAGKRRAITAPEEAANNATAMGIEIEEGKSIPLRTRWKSFTFWIIGLLVSLAPLAVAHFGEFLADGTNLFFGLFGDVEIFFICVSMLVSASCEMNSQRKNRDILNGVLLLCIVLFALLYAEFNNVELTDTALSSISFVTLISLVITLLLGSIAYFSKRR